MSDYDPSKDEIIEEIGEFKINSDEDYIVDIKSYNGGEHKAAVSKVGTKKNGQQWSKSIGRFTLDELSVLVPALQAAKEALENGKS